MKLAYEKPFSFRMGQRAEPAVSSVRHGVTEIALSDGRLIRATLHVRALKIDPKNPDSLDVTYNVISEVVRAPELPIHDIHETIQ
jgi:hypothetical protein